MRHGSTGHIGLINPSGIGKILACLCAVLFGHTHYMAAEGPPVDRPNFLIIIAEDMGPWLGCYGQEEVHTANLDALAARGIRFTQAWSSGPACSPARSSLFTGLWAPSLGTETHREERPIPNWTIWTQYLREEGYYTTNNAKTDYNADRMDPAWWDESSPTAHYVNRAPGQPFFHVYSSLMHTHMSFLLDHSLHQRHHRTVPVSAVDLPAGLPDDPAVRDDRAWHLHGVTLMDGEVGRILRELDLAGEAERTIVFFFSDHGGVLPNAKGYANHAGFHIPLILYIPPAFEYLKASLPPPGGKHEGLVSLMDIPLTVFSLAGIAPPAHLQGQALAGPHSEATFAKAPYQFAYRGINGGRWDVVRSIRRGDLIYTRNYLPFRAPGIRQNYHMRMPSQQAYEQLWLNDKADKIEFAFWRPKPPEELHDLSKDPNQIRNLSGEERYASELQAMRNLLDEHLEMIHDIGFVPNTLRAPSGFDTFYDRMTANRELAAKIREAAKTVAIRESGSAAEIRRMSHHPDASIRYWAAVGLARCAYDGDLSPTDETLLLLLKDEYEEVRILAAEAMVAAGQPAVGLPILLEAIISNRTPSREALSAVESLGSRAAPIAQALLELYHGGRDDFYLRSALITLGKLPYHQLYPAVGDPSPQPPPTHNPHLKN